MPGMQTVVQTRCPTGRPSEDLWGCRLQNRVHRRKCAEWNEKNSDYAKANALHRKVEAAKNPQPSSGCSGSLLPQGYVKEVIEVQLVVILEYLGQQLLKRLQEAIKRQAVVNKRQSGRLPP